MNSEKYLDLEDCTKSGCSIQEATRFRVRIDDDYVNVDGKTVTGRQLLDLAKRNGEHQKSIFIKRMHDGIEEIDIYHPITLEKGILCFLTLDTSIPYKYKINGKERKWYGNLISGTALKEKAGVDPYDYTVWRRTSGEPRQRIKNSRFTDLSSKVPIEFSTVPKENVANYVLSMEHEAI